MIQAKNKECDAIKITEVTQKGNVSQNTVFISSKIISEHGTTPCPSAALELRGGNVD